MYLDKPLREYLDDLAARKAAPGGGSAAALAAASGVALMSMVANFTIGNKKYKGVEEKMADLLIKLEKARGELQLLIDKDVEAYDKVAKSLKEGVKDAGRTDELYKEAAQPPFEICKLSGECLKLCKILAKFGNTNLATDTAIAAIMLEGAFFSAKFNVYGNMKYIKDLAFIEKVHKELSPLEESLPKLKEEILEICEDVGR